MYHYFKPIFLIVDEYARFSDSPLSKQIHKLVAELVQTAGYVNVHVIISTQRPDARQTLPANIKMGLMTRICFRTADKNNSIVILDEEGAETLPNIKGRAILRDGEKNIVQVPLMEYDTAEEILKPYKKESKPDVKEDDQRPTNNDVACKVQNMFKKSNSENII
jgi:S-DNA-T family DNA segregation ATPase FtsK/SpoIIIE